MDALLRPVEFHILLSLAEEDRHGYGIRSATAPRTDGDVMLEPGTIYRALHRLLGLGFVSEATPRADDDERRRTYRLTAPGRRVLHAEARRLAKLVAAAQKTRVLT